MKRTQLYIEDDIFKALQRISDEQMLSISELVRSAINKVYFKERPVDAEAILKKAAGIWSDREDISSSEDYVRRMRRDTRRERFGIK